MQVISEADKTANLYGYYKTNYGGIPCVDENISGVITIPAESEGLGSMSIGGIYEIGNEITLAASSEEGWMFKGWMIDGATVSTDVEYTLTVAEDITITAVFDKDPSAIQATRSEGATAEGYYSIDGKKQNTPQVGVNIVRMSDGTSRKILVK